MELKNVLLFVSIIVLIMGVLAMVPGVDLGTEPVWHSALKIVIGLAGIIVALKMHEFVKNTLILVGILVLLMGILGMIPGIELATEPIWHAALKVIIGAVALYMGIKSK